MFSQLQFLKFKIGVFHFLDSIFELDLNEFVGFSKLLFRFLLEFIFRFLFFVFLCR